MLIASHNLVSCATFIFQTRPDRAFQGKGYGKGALQEVLKYIASKPFGSSKTVLITCNPQNEVAYRLYRQIGFTETGKSDDDELELGITLANARPYH
ncbi:GNAT family N-acetyltransferase [Intestinimonas timonensis]|uniref:GNAT family N-acetyltransferase n=1 Tax=Intestinimonas timonensis TaxID=1689270 RepID=UPI003BF8CFC3